VKLPVIRPRGRFGPHWFPRSPLPGTRRLGKLKASFYQAKVLQAAGFLAGFRGKTLR
jgi:hypothetical protein